MKLIKKLIFKIKYKISSSKNPIKFARKLGVTVGEGCRFVSMPNFGSEPYLVEIGNHVSISSGTFFITHDGSTWVFRNQEKYKKVLKFGRIKVGDNVFIGYNVTILPGVTIGDNCIVGACSLVTKDVVPGTVVGGVPAKVITTTEAFADKCLENAPDWDEEAMKKDKRKELERVFPSKRK